MNIRAETRSSNKLHRRLFTIHPVEKTLSHETEVATTHRYCRASIASRGNSSSCAFHHSSGLIRFLAARKFHRCLHMIAIELLFPCASVTQHRQLGIHRFAKKYTRLFYPLPHLVFLPRPLGADLPCAHSSQLYSLVIGFSFLQI